MALGPYREHLNFLGKAITVTTEQGPDVTIIDGDPAGSVVTFALGEGLASVLSGFTLQNGRGGVEGGGIVIARHLRRLLGTSSPNGACTGAGIAISSGSPIIKENLITSNAQVGCSGGTGGGEILIRGNSEAQILGNIMAGNFMSSANGGGVALFAAGTPTIRGNLISGNTATGLSPCAEGGGLWLVNDSDASIVQNVIAGNAACCGGGIF